MSSFAGLGVVGRILTPPIPSFIPGGYQTVRGKVVKKGELVVLELSRAMKLDGRPVRTIALKGGTAKPGQQVTLYGRVDLRVGEPEVVLSGLSNVGAGEPRYDARSKRFVATLGSASGSELPALNLNNRDARLGAPARTGIVDSQQKKVFFANLNGSLAQGANPFHGIDSVVALRAPSRAEQLRFAVKGNQLLSKRNGQSLERLGSQGPALWFYDAEHKTALRLSGKKIDAAFTVK